METLFFFSFFFGIRTDFTVYCWERAIPIIYGINLWVFCLIPDISFYYFSNKDTQHLTRMTICTIQAWKVYTHRRMYTPVKLTVYPVCPNDLFSYAGFRFAIRLKSAGAYGLGEPK